MASVQEIRQAIQGVFYWRDAVQKMIDVYVQNGECFSSGEIAVALRAYRPDLRFSSMSVGEYVRDLHTTGRMPAYKSGGPFSAAVYPVQVSRACTGVTRTPAGTTVFVYGPDTFEAQSHKFEVEVPDPIGGSRVVPVGSSYPTQVTPPAPAPAPVLVPVAVTQSDSISPPMYPPTSTGGRTFTPVTKPVTPVPDVVELTGDTATDEPQKATVRADGRLTIPRQAMENLAAATKTTLRGRDTVYVTQYDRLITITTTKQNDDSIPYMLSIESGRVRFPSPNAAEPFVSATSFRVWTVGKKLLVDLDNVIGD